MTLKLCEFFLRFRKIFGQNEIQWKILSRQKFQICSQEEEERREKNPGERNVENELKIGKNKKVFYFFL